ncbi:MAG TPA: peptidase M20, partial [bacterium]|nr:peptidase M20 [bacterium]
MPADLHGIRAYLEKREERHLARLQTWLRQQSVSVDGEGVEACARLFVELLRDAGFPEAELVPTPGYPAVWAAYDAGAPVTLAVYGMFDVRRADPSGWRAPPFAAEVITLPPLGRVVVARGARAVKGPLCVWLNAVEACRAVWGRPPVNLLLLAEGDEILGSPHYRAMFDRYRDRLQTAQGCWSPGASQDAKGAAHLTLGYKGLIYMTLRASGARWNRGPKRAPIHGMAKAVVDSPAWRLIHALGSLTAPDGNTVLIDGFD